MNPDADHAQPPEICEVCRERTVSKLFDRDFYVCWDCSWHCANAFFALLHAGIPAPPSRRKLAVK